MNLKVTEWRRLKLASNFDHYGIRNEKRNREQYYWMNTGNLFDEQWKVGQGQNLKVII